MKKPGAEKKKVRRSAGATQNGSTDTPPRKQTAEKDVYLSFAEKVRDHKDLESRWAVLQETRVEYFRGKDFVAFLRNHPEVKEILDQDKNLEAEDIGNTLLRKSLIARCDRVVKTVRPGKKKLSTWPAHLEFFPIQTFSDNDAFFMWTFVRRRPLWQTLLSFSWPVLTLAICMFPVYPHRCKIMILYSCAGVLLLITCLLLLRAIIFGTLWILLGNRVWFFPNILAEEATLRELFQFWPKKDEEERIKWTSRLFYAGVAAVVILFLRHYSPDEAARARYHKRVFNIIDDVIEWSPRQALSEMMKPQAPFNETDPNNSTHGSEPNAFDDSPLPPEDVHSDGTDDEPEEVVEEQVQDNHSKRSSDEI